MGLVTNYALASPTVIDTRRTNTIHVEPLRLILGGCGRGVRVAVSSATFTLGRWNRRRIALLPMYLFVLPKLVGQTGVRAGSAGLGTLLEIFQKHHSLSTNSKPLQAGLGYRPSRPSLRRTWRTTSSPGYQ